MSDIPKQVVYRERLSPSAPPVIVTLPQSRDEAFDWYADIVRLFATDRVAWKAAFRQATASSWYMLYLFLSGAQRLDPFTGRPEVDCDFQFYYSLEKQFDGDNVADKTARGHWKSTWDIYVGVTNYVICSPEESTGIFSHERAAAEKHGRRLKEEWTSNVELRVGWDDVFWWNPEHEAPLWSQEKGCTVKRSIVSSTPTVSWYSIDEIPTGLRLSKFILDDIENEKTMATEELRKKTAERANSVFGLTGRAASARINFTHHHPAGWGAQLISSGAYRVRCHAAEDVTLPAPDIAAIYDECNGMLPVREEHGRPIQLSPEVRNVRLAGAPVYLHPLECAKLRLELTNQKYEEQYQGDPLAGQDKRLDPAWIRYYDLDPLDWAADSYLYVVIDASKGVSDPTFARVEATKADRSISWVGGLRHRLSPSEFGPAIFQLCMEWAHVGARIVQIRVEEFGQSTWSHNLRTYFDSRRQYVAPIVTFSSHNTNNRMREWTGLEPLYRSGKRLYPSGGILVTSDDGRTRYDLVDYYIRKELTPFPLPITDDGLAADFLLTLTEGRDEAGNKVSLSLEYPETDEQFEARTRGRWAGREQWGDRDDDSWMSQGLD